jgi:DnaK suppressor protein
MLSAWILIALVNCSRVSGERIRPARGDLARAELDEPADEGSETLYQNEFDAARTATLAADLAAVERAEQRLPAGTYGLSIESGEPTGGDRLEAFPTAERTVDEEGLSERG